jgi:hypothetical protein
MRTIPPGPAVDYVGRVRVVSDGRLSRESFSMHAVGLGSGEILDRAPCKALPPCKPLPISRSGNVSLVDRLQRRTKLVVDGLNLESIPMFYRQDVLECTVASWDNGSQGIRISDD